MATATPKAAPPTGHAGAVTAIAVGELDGRTMVVSGGTDGRLVVWDPARRLDVWGMLAPEEGEVTAVTIGDGVIVACWEDGTLRANGLERRDLGRARVKKAFSALATGPGIVLAAAGPRDLLVHGLPDLKPRGRRPLERPGPVTALATTERDDLIVGLADGLVRFDGGEAIATGAPVTALAVREIHGERAIAVGRRDGTLEVIFGDGDRVITIPTGTEPVAGVGLVVVDDHPLALTGRADGTLASWELAVVAGPQRDKVEWLPDAPSKEDLLGRMPLAKALAERLERIRAARTSFLIHIDGAWGTGKSTIMRYLAAELAPRWLVVDFNAWRHSRVGPPWWALLGALRAQVAAELGWWGRTRLRFAESWARVRRTGGPYLLAIVILAAAAAAIFLALKPAELNAATAGDLARSVSAVLAGVGTLWAGGLVAARLLLWDSAKGAKVYEQSESDPMENVVEHFAWLSRRVGRPIVFFVDDLDRCSGEYVVDLLEAVQTLVRDAAPDEEGTYFIVAADGCWVRAAYEQRYASFAGSVGEPGRPLGYLFLDKLFQLSVRVPSVSAGDQSRFLAGLLRGERSAPEARQEVEAALERLQNSSTDEEVVAALEGAAPQVRDAVRARAVEKLTEQAVQEATEHALEKFAALLEPNPRAMKRFVNAFGLARVVLTLEDVLVASDALALWTILSTRWPMLADRLRERPEEVALVGDAAALKKAVLPDDVRALLASHEVEEVVLFTDGGPLTREVIEECVAGRRAAAAR